MFHIRLYVVCITLVGKSLEGAMGEAGLTDIRKSIANRQNMVAQYIAT